jgi:putative transposase
VSEPVTRTNEYMVAATTERYRQCLFDWLAAQPPLWNQLNYRRRQAYSNQDSDVWEVDYTDLYDDYAPLIGSATYQQLARKTAKPGGHSLPS